MDQVVIFMTPLVFPVLYRDNKVAATARSGVTVVASTQVLVAANAMHATPRSRFILINRNPQ